MAARMPMIATTIINSMSVKPRWLPSAQRFLFQNLFIVAPSRLVGELAVGSGCILGAIPSGPVLITVPDAYEGACVLAACLSGRRRALGRQRASVAAGTASFAEAGLSPLTRRSVSLQRSQALETIHIGTKRAGDRHGAVGVLIVLEYGDQSPSHGEARAIQRVAVVSFAATGWAIPDFGSARL